MFSKTPKIEQKEKNTNKTSKLVKNVEQFKILINKTPAKAKKNKYGQKLLLTCVL